MPCSCIAATMPSEFFAEAESKPGKPHWCERIGDVVVPSIALTHGWLFVIAGSTYFAPKRPR